MSDRIRIAGLKADTRVGVTDEERARPQTVCVDVDIAADLSSASASDELTDTVDYSAAVARVTDVVRTSECRLLEHLASKVVSSVSCMEGVLGVTVEISKQPPPASENVAAISVRIERSFA